MRRFCHGGTKSKQLLTYNADSSDKLTPLVIGKYTSPCCFRNGERLPTEYKANTDTWMTTKIFEDYLTQPDRKLGAQSHTHISQQYQSCISPSYLYQPATALRFGNLPCIQVLLQKAVIWKTSHDRWGTVPRCCTAEAGCVVYSAFHSRNPEVDNTHCNLELPCKVWFLN
jgi:hypothetical protein